MILRKAPYFHATLLVVCLLCFNHYMLHEFKMGIFFNSDSLYAPQFVEDLKSSIVSFFDWQLSRAPSLIDIFIFFVISLFLNGYMSIICFAILQVSVSFWLVYKIFSFKFSTTFSITLTGLSFLGLLTLLLESSHPFPIILKSAHHFSEYILWGIISFLFLKYLESPRLKYLIWTVILNFIQIISDQLILIHFVLPAGITSIFLILLGQADKRKTLLFLGVLGLTTLIALVISFKMNGAVALGSSFKWGIETIHSDVIRFFDLIKSLMSGSLLVTITYIIFFSGLLYNIFKKGVQQPYLIYFLVMSVVTVVTLLIMPNNKILFRYLLPVLYTPVFFYSFFISQRLEKYLRWPFFLLMFTGFVYMVITAPKGKWNDDFYPERVRCIDAYVGTSKNKNVVGGFWDGRHISYLSKKGVTVQPFHKNFKVNKTVSNHKKIHLTYSYILISLKNKNGLKEHNVIKAFGQPKSVINCQGYQLFAYNKGSLVIDEKGILKKHETE